MIRSISLLLFFCLLILTPGILKAQFFTDFEASIAFQRYNEVRVPNAGGTTFDLLKDFEVQQPVIPVRLRFGYTFSERNHLSILMAPLGVNYGGNAPFDIAFQNSLFEQGLATEGTYIFNSYRLTYRRDFIRSETWVLGLGLTAKIRDASIRLENEAGVSDRDDDVGFVPLIHLFAAYHLPSFSIIFEGDGLAAPNGRAFDLFLGTSLPLFETVSLKAGYRILEGGADVEQVYNFTLIHYASLGIISRF